MGARKADHVVLQNNAFHCRHCGDSYKMKLPCLLGVMTAAMKAYVSAHRNCPPTPAKNGGKNVG